jgi:rhomboid family GlyGly-CTERM serine protease
MRRKVEWLMQRWWLPLVMAFLALALILFAEPRSMVWRYQREDLLAGEWWRLWSGHWVHLGWRHLALNLAGLILIWLLVGRAYSARAWLLFVIFNALFISLGLLLYLPGLAWYVGLSGILHGMLLAGALSLSLRAQREMWWLVGLVLVKLVWEFWQGASPTTEAEIGGAVIIEAHLLGALGGLFYVLVLMGIRARSARTR